MKTVVQVSRILSWETLIFNQVRRTVRNKGEQGAEGEQEWVSRTSGDVQKTKPRLQSEPTAAEGLIHLNHVHSP